MNQNTISVIIPTKNASFHLELLLKSLVPQLSTTDELIIVDNFSTDNTKTIINIIKVKNPAKNIQFYQHGPERNAQRTFGSQKASKASLLFLDADMKPSKNLLSAVKYGLKMADALIIPEKPYGAGNFWTKCKILERSFYENDDQTEAPRAFKRIFYHQIGGFNPDMVSFEDWDLTINARKHGKVARIAKLDGFLWHDEGFVTLKNLFSKKAYYGLKSTAYRQQNGLNSLVKKIYWFRRSVLKGLLRLLRRPCFFFGVNVVFLVMLFGIMWGIVMKNLKK